MSELDPISKDAKEIFVEVKGIEMARWLLRDGTPLNMTRKFSKNNKVFEDMLFHHGKVGYAFSEDKAEEIVQEVNAVEEDIKESLYSRRVNNMCTWEFNKLGNVRLITSVDTMTVSFMDLPTEEQEEVLVEHAKRFPIEEMIIYYNKPEYTPLEGPEELGETNYNVDPNRAPQTLKKIISKYGKQAMEKGWYNEPPK